MPYTFLSVVDTRMYNYYITGDGKCRSIFEYVVQKYQMDNKTMCLFTLVHTRYLMHIHHTYNMGRTKRVRNIRVD